MPPEPHRKCSKLANKDEILRMYDRTMMNYVNFILKHAKDRDMSDTGHAAIVYQSTVKEYIGKIEVLRIILGFNGNMEDK